MELNQDFCRHGLAVIEAEAKAVGMLTTRINQDFDRACQYLLNCKGRIVVLGMGKSGHIANKIAATLASTGSPSFFVHAGEASHGDMGMITSQDVILTISYSGTTDEILTLLPLIKRLKIPLITLTGNPDSTLAKTATINIHVGVDAEACPLNLAPTASTTAALAMGDALAISLLQARGFTAKDFAFSHPGGQLGRRLLLQVDTLMHKDDAVPIVTEATKLSHALIEVTQKKLGMTCVIGTDNRLTGIFTDGDLRRAIDHNVDIHNTVISEVMTKNCKTATKNLLAIEALQMMETYKITTLVVANEQGFPIGVVHMHDLLQAGLI